MVESCDFLSDLFKEKMEVVYPGIRPALPKKVREDNCIRLLFIGNDFFRKGGHLLVDSFLELYKEYPDLELIVVSAMRAGVNGRIKLYQKWSLKSVPVSLWAL